MFRLSNGWRNHDANFFVLVQYRSVTDRRTDISALAIPALA